ncbi:glycolate oxidase subunit GlcE [Segnochrobactrum spirostomi]|uniref:Glycolate oxidase subunit GlcE n=1 Tax=Segnochrobactrum spirostomi TaxID=2608987 RepID=A0A6A7Y6T9_9HYPH|nr:glycolate oxidase subunit GlcE [Segnochrobactrum spirostomi]MQT14027.1 glycolate oxidase subunit GlcE [Segnochrobactrum spirostomi]
MTILSPRDPEAVRVAIADALAADATIEVVGAGSKRALGRPVAAARTLDLSALAGITLYEPDELVLSARAGTPIAEIETLLAERHQELAFDPLDYGPLLGLPAGRGTLGGVLAANLSGPRRIRAGAARDHVLGIEAVSGRGEIFKAGGRVVKNVTGYDLPRGLAGSWGTLAVFTEITFKVLPKAETEATLVVPGLADDAAVRVLAEAMGSPADVSGAAHLPEASARRLGFDRAATAIRLEGIPSSVAARFDHLAKRIGAGCERLEADASTALWRAVRDVAPLCAAGDGAAPRVPHSHLVWRVSVAPTAGPDLVAALAADGLAPEVVYDWAGGLVWIALALADDAHALRLRRLVAAAGGGHATLVRAPEATRSRVPVFEPQPAGLAALSNRLRTAFDPRGLLNPGRMHAPAAVLDAA